MTSAPPYGVEISKVVAEQPPMAHPRPSAPPRAAWRVRDSLKLVGARRGDGLLVCSNLTVPAAYEIDVFSQGTVRRVNGALEGDFSVLMSDHEPGERQMLGARLKLDDGHEIDIDLVVQGPSAATFDVRNISAGADLLR